MAQTHPRTARRHAVAHAATLLWLGLGSSSAHAQSPATPDSVTLPAVVVIERLPQPAASVTGLGDAPLWLTPVAAQVIDARQISDAGATRLADLLKFDASTSDAYNAVGYWDYATVRGYVLDNKFNYRREGLPINAETNIALDNKERVEVLKGTSGMQAGTSAPGGLIEYSVKRPTAAPLRRVLLQANGDGGTQVSIDLSDRFGAYAQWGYRLNLAAERISATVPKTQGERQLAALALDWKASASTLLQAEAEYSSRSQPSVPGLSLTGTTLPEPDPRLNINSQPWSLPVVLQGTTGSVKWTQQLGAEWRSVLQWGSQRLTSQDRTAFAYGCTAADGSWVGDRYCANGDFDLYDYRSENERRQTDAAQWQLQGKTVLAGVVHQIGLGLTHSHVQEHFQPQAYNWVGTLHLAALTPVAADPSAITASAQRNERSAEWVLTDVAQWTPRLQSWLGLRHSQLRRDSIRTDGTEPSHANQSVTSPWAALSYRVSERHMVYASAGRGAESQVAPNRPSQYTNAGRALPTLASRQWELGIKSNAEGLNWQANVFDISRPVSNVDACNRLYILPCTAAFDGTQRHRGAEMSAQWHSGPWSMVTSASALRATREGSLIEPGTNSQRPSNVPTHVLRAQVNYRVAAHPGLSLHGHWSHEGERNVLPDGTVTLPAWHRLDAGLRYNTTMLATPTIWTLDVNNLLNSRYFKESPYQFGHVYLFPGAARQLRISAQASF